MKEHPGYLSIHPEEKTTAQFHALMLSTIAPRPIALVSSIDLQGHVNLSPFSFFNAFGSNPPVLIFSPARRVRDNTIKHTLENAFAVPEVVVNMINYAIVEQMSLSSCEYERGINEFIKSGLTPISSDLVSPPRVAESPAQFECKIMDIIETGTEGGAGNLVICHIVKAHFQADIFDLKGQVDPDTVDLVARMGGDWYCRASGPSLFAVPKPNVQKGIGFDQIPTSVLNSTMLTGNELGRLANIVALPGESDLQLFKESEWYGRQGFSEPLSDGSKARLFLEGKLFLEANQLHEAWCCLLLSM